MSTVSLLNNALLEDVFHGVTCISLTIRHTYTKRLVYIVICFIIMVECTTHDIKHDTFQKSEDLYFAFVNG